MTRLAIPSFAKINWILKILGKRNDGYHQIRTIYQTINLHDEVIFETTHNKNIQLEIRGKDVAQSVDNLLYRAAKLLQDYSGHQAGVRISLHKKIPIGAGLGGGSSNAAMALLALNQLWQCQLCKETLATLAAQLGSDVPFFLVGGQVAAGGRGEQLLPLSDIAEKQTLLLLYPYFELASHTAYSLGQWDDHAESDLSTSAILDTTMHRLVRTLDSKKYNWSLLENDFERTLFQHYPILVEAKSILENMGCERVMLCGSGSTLLGFGNIKTLEKIADSLSHQEIGEVFTCQTLSRSQYRQFLTDSGLDDV